MTFDLSSIKLYIFGPGFVVSEPPEDKLKAKHDIDGRFVNDEADKPLDSDIQVMLLESIRDLLKI